MNSWDEWIQRHRSEMEHIADYEIRFVREVLSKIPELEPEDVIPQYPFFDEKKKLRRIDFMILNVDNGFALAIEIDGYWKAENYANFDEMLSRQNALLENMNCLLIRYSNKKWINNRKVVIAEIREVLQKQNIEHQTRLLQKEHQLKVDQQINKIIEESQLIKQEIQQVRKEVERSAQSKDPIILQDTSEKSSVQNKTKTILPLFFVTCLILLGFFFYEQSNNQVTAETVNVPNVVDTTKTEAKARQIPYGDSNDDLMIITHGLKNDRLILKENGLQLVKSNGSLVDGFCTYNAARRTLRRENHLSLEDLCNECGYYLHHAHNAYNDVWAEVAIYTYLKKIEKQHEVEEA